MYFLHCVKLFGDCGCLQLISEVNAQTAFQVLTGVFGVGAKTADRWIRDGIHTLHQLRDSGHPLNRDQQAGVCLGTCVYSCTLFSLDSVWMNPLVFCQVWSTMSTSISRSLRRRLALLKRSWQKPSSLCYQEHRLVSREDSGGKRANTTAGSVTGDIFRERLKTGPSYHAATHMCLSGNQTVQDNRRHRYKVTAH